MEHYEQHVLSSCAQFRKHPPDLSAANVERKFSSGKPLRRCC
jgi:hypothetical protein